MKKTIIFLLVTLMFFAACTPAASQNASPQPTAELDEVLTEEPVMTDNPEETAEPVATEEPASTTPEPEAYKPRDEFEQLIFDSFKCANNKDYYGWAGYWVSMSDDDVAYLVEIQGGIVSGEHYHINFMHEVDVEYANGTVLNMERYAIVKNNLPMPDYLEDDSLVKAYYVCVSETPKGYGTYDYHVHIDYLFILVNIDGQWLIFGTPKINSEELKLNNLFDPHELYENS